MKQEITLIKAQIGLSNIDQDHVLRHQAMNIQNNDVDVLMEGRLGNTGRISGAILNEVAGRTGGLSMNPGGDAFIEDGWGNSRGLCQLEFLITSNAMREEKMVIMGYIHGGSPSMDDGVPEDAFFLPVRMWNFETTQQQNFQGFVESRTNISQSAQFLLNDHRSQGLHTIRPRDIVESSSGLASQLEEDSWMSGGGDDNYAGSSSASLKLSGLSMSKTQNNAPATYARSLLNASLRAGSAAEQNPNNQYGAISDALNDSSLRELNIRENPFIGIMRRIIGRTDISGFEGFTFGEIAHVFSNFTDVLYMEATDVDRFEIVDSRMATDIHGTGNMCEVLCNELAQIAQQVLIGNSVSSVQIEGTNDVEQGSFEINGLPIDYLVGGFMPITDGLNLDLEGTRENIKEMFTQLFFARHCSDYYHQRQLVSFEADLHLFGQSNIRVFINGDEGTARQMAYATYALNRFDPTLVDRNSAMQSTRGFYDNLVSHFNI